MRLLVGADTPLSGVEKRKERWRTRQPGRLTLTCSLLQSWSVETDERVGRGEAGGMVRDWMVLNFLRCSIQSLPAFLCLFTAFVWVI